MCTAGLIGVNSGFRLSLFFSSVRAARVKVKTRNRRLFPPEVRKRWRQRHKRECVLPLPAGANSRMEAQGDEQNFRWESLSRHSPKVGSLLKPNTHPQPVALSEQVLRAIRPRVVRSTGFPPLRGRDPNHTTGQGNVQASARYGSNFGMLGIRCAREAKRVRFGRLELGDARKGSFSAALRRVSGGAHGELNCYGAKRQERRV